MCTRKWGQGLRAVTWVLLLGVCELVFPDQNVGGRGGNFSDIPFFTNFVQFVSNVFVILYITKEKA